MRVEVEIEDGVIPEGKEIVRIGWRRSGEQRVMCRGRMFERTGFDGLVDNGDNPDDHFAGVIVRDIEPVHIQALRRLYEAARGLSFGEDWNNGTAAKLHGYRQKLIDAIQPAAEAIAEWEASHV